jgi:hypothetical protein
MGDRLTITLTGRPPVRIRKDDWPIIASASGEHPIHEGHSTGEDDYALFVRLHADGRALVYGRACHPGAYNWVWSRGGELLGSGADLAESIKSLAG